MSSHVESALRSPRHQIGASKADGRESRASGLDAGRMRDRPGRQQQDEDPAPSEGPSATTDKRTGTRERDGSGWETRSRRDNARAHSPPPLRRRAPEPYDSARDQPTVDTRAPQSAHDGEHRPRPYEEEGGRRSRRERDYDADRRCDFRQDREEWGVSRRRDLRAPLAPRGVYDDSGRRVDHVSTPLDARHNDFALPRKRTRDSSVDKGRSRGDDYDRQDARRHRAASPAQDRRQGRPRWGEDQSRRETGSDADLISSDSAEAASKWAEREDSRPRASRRQPAPTSSAVRDDAKEARESREAREEKATAPTRWQTRSPVLNAPRGPKTDSRGESSNRWHRKTPPLGPRADQSKMLGPDRSSSPGRFAEDKRTSRQRTPTGPSGWSEKRRGDGREFRMFIGDDVPRGPRAAQREDGRDRGWGGRSESGGKWTPPDSSEDRRGRKRSSSPSAVGLKDLGGSLSGGHTNKRHRSRAEQGVASVGRNLDAYDDEVPDGPGHRHGRGHHSPLRAVRRDGETSRRTLSPASDQPALRISKDDDKTRYDGDYDRDRDATGYRHYRRREPDLESDSRSRVNGRSRRSRSPEYSGRVLSRKESNAAGIASRRRTEASEGVTTHSMQTVRGTGWQTVRAPVRSSAKNDRSPERSDRPVAADDQDHLPSQIHRQEDESGRNSTAATSSREREPNVASAAHEPPRRPSNDRRNPNTASFDRRSSGLAQRPADPPTQDSVRVREPQEEDDGGARRAGLVPDVPSLDPPRAEPGEGYLRIQQVGEGTYGQVFKARSERTGVLVALKRIRMEAEKDGFPVTAMREIKLLQALRHENIVRLHEMMVARSSIYMVFEYMEHDLNGILAHPQIRFSPAHLKSLSGQLLKGLAYLHRKSVLHRDLKGSNILINNQGLLKLADFGLARFYFKRRRGDYTNRVVTLWYRPPELLFGATQYGPEVDMWGAGCIFLELFTRRPAFQGNTEVNQLQVISDVLGPFTPARWPEARKLPWYELVKPVPRIGSSEGEAVENGGTNGINANVAQRTISRQNGGRDTPQPHGGKREAEVQRLEGRIFEEAFGSAMPASALEVVCGLLSYDPERRMSANDALTMDYFSEAPRAEMPAGLLSGIEGEWHEYESRQARRKASKRAHDKVQADARVAHTKASEASTDATAEHRSAQFPGSTVSQSTSTG
ncbi:kinase subunit of RNA polymerase II carboxy-terminal domain kinase I [Thecaphora frezii]